MAVAAGMAVIQETLVGMAAAKVAWREEEPEEAAMAVAAMAAAEAAVA